MDNIKINVLVTGGSGFLGKSIVRELLEEGAPVRANLVRVFDLKDAEEHRADRRIEFFKGDVREASALNEACKGIDLVIHSAAVVDWGVIPDEEVLAVNLTGTENVISACIHNRVKYMVFTSSLDATYSGKPLVNVDESLPYPAVHKTTYCRSKALAEQAVIKAQSDQFKAVILRPSDIYGEADPYHIGSLINMAKGGFYVRLGDGRAKCQHIYVGNIAYGHLQAAAALMKGHDHICGQVYFMTDAPASNFFSFFDQVVFGAGYKMWPRNLWIPRPVAYAMGSLSEFFAWLIRPVKKYHPKFSRFAVVYTCTDYTFTSSRAMKDWGFKPKYHHNEGLERTIAYYQKLKAEG
jgi:nucleoside-diphosphate-sugar epimerase